MATSLVKSICNSHENLHLDSRIYQRPIKGEVINFSIRLSGKEGFYTADIISERVHSKNFLWNDLEDTLFVFPPGLFCFTLKYSELVEILFLACSSYIFFFCNNKCELEKAERKTLKYNVLFHIFSGLYFC